MKALSMYFNFTLVAFASFLFFAGCEAPASDSSEDVSSMKSAVDQFVNAWNSKDVSNLGEFMSEDFERWENGEQTVDGLEEMKNLMKGNFSMSSDATVTLGDTYYYDDHSFVYWTYAGTNTGPIDEGIPATGNSFSVDGFAINTYNEEGHMTREEIFFDTWSMNEQLGFKMMPPAQEKEAAAEADAEEE